MLLSLVERFRLQNKCNIILDLKKGSKETVNKIAEEVSSKIIENLTGEKLNDSSIKASVEEISKNRIGKYL